MSRVAIAQAVLPLALIVYAAALARCSPPQNLERCTPGTELACSCLDGSPGLAVCSPSGEPGACACAPGAPDDTDPPPADDNDPPPVDDNDPPPVDDTDPPVEEEPEPDTDPYGAPMDLNATALGPTAVDLTWRPAPDASGGYRVYRDGVFLASAGEPRHEDRTVAAGTRYSYTVTVGSGDRESVHSEPAVITTPQVNQSGDFEPGAFRTHATIHSVGFEWDILGDPDHDATATLSYRAAGAAAWKDAMPLMRIDFNGLNMLAGSLLFLQPGTEYEVVINATDPDGGSHTRRETVRTRAVPALPTGGRTFHVMPGSNGGDGSAGNPFRGVATAAAAAKPGDVMLLHAGNYGGRITFSAAGEPGRHVAWKAAGDGDAVFAGIEVGASHMRLEGLRVVAGGGYDFTIGIRTKNAPKDVAVVGCTIVENHKAIYLTGGGSDWYVADNVIVGDNTVESGSFSGEGVELNHTAGHVVAHNRISLVGDGASYCDRNCDFYGNDIFDTSDDGLEPDGGYANIRMWGNRIQNAGHNGISFQPQNGGPWYLIRNQVIGHSEGPLKYRGTDRFVLAHNTFVQWTDVSVTKADQLLAAWARNNVWISVRGGTVWNLGAGVPDWRTSLDYDGFDWGGGSTPFRMGGRSYSDIASFAAGTGLMKNGVRLSRSCFPTLNVPAAPPASVPSQSLTLAAGCPAIDVGVVLPNINDGFKGDAPDLGAFESGATPLHFGPRI